MSTTQKPFWTVSAGQLECGSGWESVRLYFNRGIVRDKAQELAEAIKEYPSDVPLITKHVEALMREQGNTAKYVASAGYNTGFCMSFQRNRGSEDRHWYAAHVEGSLHINETTLAALRKLLGHSSTPQAAIEALKARWIRHLDGSCSDIFADSPAWFNESAPASKEAVETFLDTFAPTT